MRNSPSRRTKRVDHVIDGMMDLMDLGLILEEKFDKISDVLILSDMGTEMGRKSWKIPQSQT